MADLATTLNATIASAVGTLSAAAQVQSIGTLTATAGTWNRDNFLLSIVDNKSCIGCWRSDPTYTFASYLTFISPHHAITNTHVGPFPEHQAVYGWDEDGAAVALTASGYPYQIPGTDVVVFTFTTNVETAGIQVANVMPSDWRRYIDSSTNSIYTVFARQDRALYIGETTGARLDTTSTFVRFDLDTAEYADWGSAIPAGDSTGPLFVVIDGSLVLLGTLQGGWPGDAWVPSVADLTALKNYVEDSGDSLTYADLSTFTETDNGSPDVQPVPTPGDDMSTYRIGTGGDYATMAAAYAAWKLQTSSGDLTWTIIGGAARAAAAITASELTNSTSTPLIIIADTANTLAVSTAAVSATGGAANIRNAFTLTLDPVVIPSLTMRGIAFGSQGSVACKVTINHAGTTSATIQNSLFCGLSAGTTLAINSDNGSVTELENVGFCNWIGPGTSTANSPVTISQLAGHGTVSLSHCSAAVGNITGFFDITMADNGILSLPLTNSIFSGTANTYKLFSTITLASGAATLSITSSGVRGGVINNATAVAAAGVVVVEDWSDDCLDGLTNTEMYKYVPGSLQILANASTLCAATTTAIATDVDGDARPTTNGTQSELVFAGMQNYVIDDLYQLLTTGATTLTLTVTDSVHFVTQAVGNFTVNEVVASSLVNYTTVGRKVTIDAIVDSLIIATVDLKSPAPVSNFALGLL